MLESEVEIINNSLNYQRKAGIEKRVDMHTIKEGEPSPITVPLNLAVKIKGIWV